MQEDTEGKPGARKGQKEVAGKLARDERRRRLAGGHGQRQLAAAGANSAIWQQQAKQLRHDLDDTNTFGRAESAGIAAGQGWAACPAPHGHAIQGLRACPKYLMCCAPARRHAGNTGGRRGGGFPCTSILRTSLPTKPRHSTPVETARQRTCVARGPARPAFRPQEASGWRAAKASTTHQRRLSRTSASSAPSGSL